MTVPIPDPDNIPDLIELNARQDHAIHLRTIQPGITDREILDAWDALGGGERALRIAEAQRQLIERAAR